MAYFVFTWPGRGFLVCENLMAATHARWDRLAVTLGLDDGLHFVASSLDHLDQLLKKLR